MVKRIINLGSGSYHAHIEGDYIEGKKKDKQPSKPTKNTQPTIDVDVISREVVEETANDGETINTNGANYIEQLGGKTIERIVKE